MKNELETHYTN